MDPLPSSDVIKLPPSGRRISPNPPDSRNVVLRLAVMQGNGFTGSVAALRRKLQALTAIAEDEGATTSEKAVAATLKRRLERRLREAGAPAGDWTDHAFRLGRWAKNLGRAASPDEPNGNWTDHAHRLGKAVGRGYRKWLSG